MKHFTQPTPGFAQAISDAFRQSCDRHDREDEEMAAKGCPQLPPDLPPALYTLTELEWYESDVWQFAGLDNLYEYLRNAFRPENTIRTGKLISRESFRKFFSHKDGWGLERSLVKTEIGAVSNENRYYILRLSGRIPPKKVRVRNFWVTGYPCPYPCPNPVLTPYLPRISILANPGFVMGL